MTRELIEAAKAVLEAAYYNVPHDVSTDQGAKRYAAFQRLYAAVRAAEAAPVADAERVLEAAKAAVIAIPGFKNISALSQWAVGLVADAIRPYITPAPVADTVAVPIETLRELRLIATKPLTDQDCRNVCAAVRATVDALLPPPPAPEPSVPGDVIDQWNREAVDYANEQFPEPPEVNRAARYGYVAARRAEWVRTQKGGG